jgi:hypothetical protein
MNTQVELSQEYGEVALGTSIKDSWDLTEIKVDHIEYATEKAMQFEGVWLPKSMIYGLLWGECFTGDEALKAKTVKAIVIPTWLARREGL